MKFQFIFAFLSIFTHPYLNIHASQVNSTNVNALKSHLLENYSPYTIPAVNEPLNLSVGVAFRAFSNIDQKEGIITLNLWLRYRWKDYNLAWNESEWNISSLTFPTEPGLNNIVWTPDIYLYNTAENPLENLRWTNVKVLSSGDLLWSRPGIIQSTCSFDMTDFPYDSQHCYLKFGSWSYTGSQIRLIEQNTIIDTSNYQKNEEWILDNVEYSINVLKYACCPDDYYDITFNIVLKRLTGYYETNIIIPTFATASLILITLFIPWDSGERISFAVTVMLSIIVFLLILSDTLPKSNHQPLLSRMIMALTFFSLFGVLFTVMINALNNYNLHRLKDKKKIDNKIVRALYNFCKLFCKFKSKCNTTKPPEIENGESTVDNNVDLEFDEAIEILGLNKRSNSYSKAITKNDNIKMNIMPKNKINDNKTTILVSCKDNDKLNPLQEECEYMIETVEIVYSLIFFIAFVSLCIFMFSAKN